MKKEKLCVLGVSGGLDSYVLYHYMLAQGYKVKPVYFMYGSKQEDVEKEVIERLYPKVFYHYMSLPFLGNDMNDYRLLKGSGNGGKIDYIPARNTIFFAFLQCIAENECRKSDKYENIAVSLGVTLSGNEGFPDTRVGYLSGLQHAMKISTDEKIRLEFPLGNFERFELITLATEILKITPEMLAETYSCYSGNQTHCGECHACISRQKGFRTAGVKDHTIYRKGV